MSCDELGWVSSTIIRYRSSAAPKHAGGSPPDSSKFGIVCSTPETKPPPHIPTVGYSAGPGSCVPRSPSAQSLPHPSSPALRTSDCRPDTRKRPLNEGTAGRAPTTGTNWRFCRARTCADLSSDIPPSMAASQASWQPLFPIPTPYESQTGAARIRSGRGFVTVDCGDPNDTVTL